ncbi:hypothetical protein Ddc_16656 [Ditylenchus destructor]|nr:hypothetical protein Ddc_16656 [Ditylenchus destructor]
MRKSTRLAEKQAKHEKDTQSEPQEKKTRSENTISNIHTMDNGTMVEILKYLNYMQLAKSSLVSKRFSSLIRTHRHSLALLYVDYIYVRNSGTNRSVIRMFDKKISPKAYNEWAIGNHYSKQIPSEGQVAGKQCGGLLYVMKADYKDSNQQPTTAFFVHAELIHENWPLFQHFVRLLTDPFIYIRLLKLTPQIDISFLNLLAKAQGPDSSRLQCDILELLSERTNHEDNVQKLIGWIKGHVLCSVLRVCHRSDSNFDEELLDFFVTGAHCTSAIFINYYDASNAIDPFLKKFMNLKDREENQMAESIRCCRADRILKVLKPNYAEYIVKEEKDKYRTVLLFELTNNDIGKRLQITTRTMHTMHDESDFLLEIKNL